MSDRSPGGPGTRPAGADGECFRFPGMPVTGSDGVDGLGRNRWTAYHGIRPLTAADSATAPLRSRHAGRSTRCRRSGGRAPRGLDLPRSHLSIEIGCARVMMTGSSHSVGPDKAPRARDSPHSEGQHHWTDTLSAARVVSRAIRFAAKISTPAWRSYGTMPG